MEASEVLLNAVFYAMALGAVGGSLAVAASRNIVRSAFALLVVLFSVAGLYGVMKADFIAASQVLIYVGGILVLIIFAVMLTHKITNVKLSNDATPGPAALCACLCLLFSLAVAVVSAGRWRKGPEEFETKDKTVRLSQYQLDGRTAIGRGGATFETAAVLAVRLAPAPKESVPVEFVLQPEGAKAPVRKTALVKAGSARAEFRDLPEGKATWGVVLAGAALAAGGAPDLVVFPGVTEPVALGLAGRYLFAFEVVSVLLLAALVGAAYLARKEVKG